jgi:tetraacyldisaccharide 4'-kinase
MEHCVHLLDDGMQHRRLARDVEIVVVHASDLSSALLPAGRLREPLHALERADFVVLRESDAELAARVQRWMRPDATLWQMRRALSVPRLPGPAVVFSAIAHPAEFATALRRKDVQIAAEHAWRDHHRFSPADLAVLRRSLADCRAACFVTTEKDAVRLTADQRSSLERSAPLMVVPLTAHLPEEVIAALETRLRRVAPAPKAV